MSPRSGWWRCTAPAWCPSWSTTPCSTRCAGPLLPGDLHRRCASTVLPLGRQPPPDSVHLSETPIQGETNFSLEVCVEPCRLSPQNAALSVAQLLAASPIQSDLGVLVSAGANRSVQLPVFVNNTDSVVRLAQRGSTCLGPYIVIADLLPGAIKSAVSWGSGVWGAAAVG